MSSAQGGTHEVGELRVNWSEAGRAQGGTRELGELGVNSSEVKQGELRVAHVKWVSSE